MAESTVQIVPSKSGILDQLALYKTYLAAAKVRLFQDSLVPTPDTLVADFIAAEATFTGYTAGLPTYSAVGLDAAGEPAFLSSRLFFQATDAVSPNSIGGYWLESAAGVLQFYGVFNTPVPLNAALTFLALTLVIRGVPSGEASEEF